MKLTTKRNRWYFFRELFSYMIPMILIVGTIDVFYRFVQCSLHPEWSAPCSLIRIFAVMYGFFLTITIILAIISAKKLRKIKKRIEEEFLEATNNIENKEIQKLEEKSEEIKKEKTAKPKRVIVKVDKKGSTDKEIKQKNNVLSKKRSSVKVKNVKK